MSRSVSRSKSRLHEPRQIRPFRKDQPYAVSVLKADGSPVCVFHGGCSKPEAVLMARKLRSRTGWRTRVVADFSVNVARKGGAE
jgi:hypothetical protein